MEVPIYLMTESLVLPIVNKVKEQYLVLWLSVLVVLFHVRIKWYNTLIYMPRIEPGN